MTNVCDNDIITISNEREDMKMRYQVYAPMYNSETDKVEMVCIAMFNRIAFVSMFTSTYES